MYARAAIGWLALIVCSSCTPSHRVRTSARVPAPVIADDRRLLQRLALAAPTDTAASVPAPVLPNAPPPFLAGAVSVDDERRAADCLSAAVYYEARSEPLDGQRAVAQVVLNRVRDRAFPASVCRVVYQRSGAGCQFSFACDGSTARPIEPRAWRIAEAIARAALGGEVYAPVGAATHYHTTAILPWWAASLSRIGTIGSHIFYRWGDRLGGALSFRQAYSGREPGQVVLTAGAPAADGGDPTITSTAGVTVHRGQAAATPAAVFGVRVHRGGSAMPEAAGAATATPAAATDVPAAGVSFTPL